ncbi:hypothetical protein GCE86_06710 [Micromonospora terminaliae]|uniref:Uncharacterized protein n=1 Tax=Micromonospora terminaliae TaxID=1914461 RepID=A0AAJ2ZHZ3_9ACTN|nr:hypothetical protein [Micromonospora terminaliae]NES30060.1 hypothetical protein [Micromonospora terminaliae]QGL46767.1 hypothetical protein GCE86_06710 [Micromonospora terminaliae]
MINPWRLVDKIRTNAKTGLAQGSGLGRTERVAGAGRWRPRRDPGGVVVDGVVWPLEGEPPVAQGGNWWGDSGSGGGPRTAPETTK